MLNKDRHQLVTGLESILTMFVAYVQHQSAKNSSNWSRTAACFGIFIQTSGREVNWKKFYEFLSNLYVTYLWCVITTTNKSQNISAYYVKYVLFI